MLIDCLCVDNLIYVGHGSEKLIVEFKSHMINGFEMMDLSFMNYFLGLEVKQCEWNFYLLEKKYTIDLLNERL